MKKTQKNRNQNSENNVEVGIGIGMAKWNSVFFFIHSFHFIRLFVCLFVHRIQSNLYIFVANIWICSREKTSTTVSIIEFCRFYRRRISFSHHHHLIMNFTLKNFILQWKMSKSDWYEDYDITRPTKPKKKLFIASI